MAGTEIPDEPRDWTALPDNTVKRARIIATPNLERLYKDFQRRVGTALADLAKRGLARSTIQVQDIAQMCERDLEARGEVAWQALTRAGALVARTPYDGLARSFGAEMERRIRFEMNLLRETVRQSASPSDDLSPHALSLDAFADSLMAKYYSEAELFVDNKGRTDSGAERHADTPHLDPPPPRRGGPTSENFPTDPSSFRILNSQKEQIARVLAKHGFHPIGDFAWGTRNAQGFSGWDMDVPTLFHRASGYFCSFSPSGYQSAGYDIQFSPTHDGVIGSIHADDWAEALHVVERWAVALAYELQSVDPWADLVAYPGLLTFPTVAEDQNTRFTADELQGLSYRLDDLRMRIAAAGVLAEPQMRTFNAFVDHQKLAAGRLGRIDWANQFVGGLVTFVLTLALSPEARAVVLSAANAVGGWVTAGIAAGFHLLH